MSFSQEQKKWIISQPIKTMCCKHAFLEGILASRGHKGNGEISISINGDENIGFLSDLISDVFNSEVYLLKSRGGRRKIIAFSSKSACKYLDLVEKEYFCSLKCQSCQSAFLRGVFLACGRVSDPSIQYSLEFSVGERAMAFAAFLEKLGFVPKTSVKKTETIVYFRDTTYIEDFFALANMNQTLYSFMNSKINREIKNYANRISNCETNNIERAVLASMEKIDLIEELIETGRINLLPDELAQTARLRVENRDMSLSQLAGIMTPSISKSGLSHRLARIEEMSKEILKHEKN